MIDGFLIQGNRRSVKIERGTRYLINPGSIGQPRDRNPYLSFALYDSNNKIINFFRIKYDIEKAKTKIMNAELPPALAERLTLGI
jgi:diadenosine tetraphosphatase ApaH/serine/threonine PP2A family protein phosphatase